MDNPITVPLPQDLPTNWTYGQTVSPNGSEVGLSEQYGYNYLMAQVNAAQKAAAECGINFKNAVEQTIPSSAGNLAALDAEGNLLDSGKTESDFAPSPLKQNIILYVNADTGSDSNDGLAPERAKKTIMAAVNSIPKDLGGFQAVINLAAGTYTETVAVNGFYGRGASARAGVNFYGEDGTTIINGNVSVNSDSGVFFQYVKIQGLLAAYYSRLYIIQSSVSNNGLFAIDLIASDMYGYSLEIQNSTGTGIRVLGNAFISNISGNVSGVGILAGSNDSGIPGLVVIGNNTMTAGTKYQKAYGGAIIENGVLV